MYVVILRILTSVITEDGFLLYKFLTVNSKHHHTNNNKKILFETYGLSESVLLGVEPSVQMLR